MKYTVYAKCVSYCCLHVDADSEEEAWGIAEEADGGDFKDTGDGDWEIDEVVEGWN